MYGLSDQNITDISHCFAIQDNVEEVWLYGSRAKGNFRPGSDVDLTIKGKSLALTDLYRIENALDDLLLPYTFDLSLYHQIDNKDLLAHIERVGKVFYKR
ncbi:MAG: nucleotidyltransferase domain-containing protein [Cytophagales bacterium]|nr:nucleotidyltransferase domain-containing protein [Cytophagales bacterium]